MAIVAVTGLASLDFVFGLPEMPTCAEKYRAETQVNVSGGGGANAAVAITRLGGDARYVTRLGQDATGDMIMDSLAGEGLDLSGIHRFPDGRSPCSSVLVDGNGERQIVNFRGAGLDPDPRWMNLAQPFDAALADTRWFEGALALMQAAARRGVPAVLDAEAPVQRELARAASHVAFSEQGLRDFTSVSDAESGLKLAAAELGGWVAVTLGGDGVLIAGDDGLQHVPAFPVDVVDTLAAGDVWHGAFALRLGEGADEITATTFANAAAALKCLRLGGRAAAPDRAETEAFMAERGA